MQKYRKEEIITHVPASKGNDKCYFLDHFFPCYAFTFPCCVRINVHFYNTTKDFTGVIKTSYTSIQLQQWTNCLTVTKTSEPVQRRAGSCWERGLMSSQVGGLGSDAELCCVREQTPGPLLRFRSFPVCFHPLRERSAL